MYYSPRVMSYNCSAILEESVLQLPSAVVLLHKSYVLQLPTTVVLLSKSSVLQLPAQLQRIFRKNRSEIIFWLNVVVSLKSSI